MDRFRFNETLFVPAAALLGPRGATGLGVLGGLAVAAVLQARLGVGRPDTWAWPMAAALIASPVVYPWYLLWLLPFTLSGRTTLPLLAWSVSILATYVVWSSAALGGARAVPPGVLAIEAVAAGVLIGG